MSNGKCDATGKTCFESKGLALEEIIRFKNIIKMKTNGRRFKHRIKKPEQCRVYLCEHCGFYHQTKWEQYGRKKEK